MAASPGGAAPAYVGARRMATVHAARLTNFYPLYDGANDQVDRVLPVRRTIFQRVFPRYELSTSETRDQGVGPTFIEIPDWETPLGAFAGPRRGDSASRQPAPAELALRETAALRETRVAGPRAPLEAGLGRRIDMLI